MIYAVRILFLIVVLLVQFNNSALLASDNAEKVLCKLTNRVYDSAKLKTTYDQLYNMLSLTKGPCTVEQRRDPSIYTDNDVTVAACCLANFCFLAPDQRIWARRYYYDCRNNKKSGCATPHDYDESLGDRLYDRGLLDRNSLPNKETTMIMRCNGLSHIFDSTSYDEFLNIHTIPYTKTQFVKMKSTGMVIDKEYFDDRYDTVHYNMNVIRKIYEYDNYYNAVKNRTLQVKSKDPLIAFVHEGIFNVHDNNDDIFNAILNTCITGTPARLHSVSEYDKVKPTVKLIRYDETVEKQLYSNLS